MLDWMMHTTQFKTGHKVLTYVRTKKTGAEAQVAGTGAAGMRDATVRMKKVTGGVSVLGALGDSGSDVREVMLQKLGETDHTHREMGGRAAGGGVALIVEKEAIAEIAAGASPRMVEVKYDLSTGYVQHALRRRYGSPEAAKMALQGLVNEGAMACMVKALVEIPNMSGPQAVMSASILIDKSLALEKSISDRPKTIDFGALADMGKTLKVLRDIQTQKPVARGVDTGAVGAGSEREGDGGGSPPVAPAAPDAGVASQIRRVIWDE